MSVIGLAWAFLLRRWGQALPALLAGALGIAAVETVLIVQRELPVAAERAFGGVDLVIGPKGSALDLVLCCVLEVSEPRALIPLQAALQLVDQPAIRVAAPIALGDNLHGRRIVGTTTNLLSVYHAKFATGGPWSKPLQAVVGAEAAHALGLKLGDSFVGAHGLGEGGEEHTEFPYTVTGILAPTGSALDRVLLTSIESVWTIHHHHEAEEAAERGEPAPTETPPAATAILAALRSPVALVSLPRQIDATERFSAAVPAFEMARLSRAARPVITAVMAIGLLFAVLAAATAATALAGTVSARVRDLALLRALGAHPWELAAIALVEAAILAMGALALGLGLVLILAPLAANLLAERDGLLLSAMPTASDLVWLAGGALTACLVAAMIPSLRAARAPIEKVLTS
jgi:putative ABC transport system permease protein